MTIGTRGRYIFDDHPAREAEIQRLRQIARMYEQRTEVLIDSFEMANDSRILDAGCGLGGALYQFAHSTKGLVYGLDLSRDLLDLAQLDVVHQGENNVRLVQGDMHDMPFEDGYFDIVFSRFALKHTFDPAHCVSELSRVLRPGGRLCVIEKDIQAGFAMWYPPFPFAQMEFIQAINRLNASPQRGGNSNAGRLLKHLFVRNGVAVTSVSVECCPMTKGDGPDAELHREMFLDVYRNNIPLLVGKGLITAESANRDVETLASFLKGEGNFAVSVNFTVVGTKRGRVSQQDKVSSLASSVPQDPTNLSGLEGLQPDQFIGRCNVNGSESITGRGGQRVEGT